MTSDARSRTSESSDKRIICRKAYLEGKTTPEIARETCHSPEAVDRYLLDFARIYFAHVERGLSVAEVVFAVQKPRYLVEEYVRLIAELDVERERVYERCALGQWKEEASPVAEAPPVAEEDP